MLIAGRIMLGIGIGAANQSVPLYLSEVRGTHMHPLRRCTGWVAPAPSCGQCCNGVHCRSAILPGDDASLLLHTLLRGPYPAAGYAHIPQLRC